MAPWETEYTKIFHHASYPAISPARPELSAAGKTILVSGGGRGLGTKIVEAFAQASAGHIIVLGRSLSALSATAASVGSQHPSTKISTVAGDVSREEDVARAFAEVKRLSPAGVDVLVANAGYLPAVGPVAAALGGDAQADDDAAADWWRAFEVNVKGTCLLARHFLAAAAVAGRADAVFVNVSAAAAHVNPALPGFSPYAASKLGAARLVETLQVENGGLRFYNVHPGCVKSDMLTKAGLEALGDELPLDEGKQAVDTWASSDGNR